MATASVSKSRAPKQHMRPAGRSQFSEATEQQLRYLAENLADSAARAADVADEMSAKSVKAVRVKGAAGTMKAMHRISYFTMDLNTLDFIFQPRKHATKKEPTAHKTESMAVDLFFQIEVEGNKRTLKRVTMDERDVYRGASISGNGRRTIVVKASVELPYKLEAPPIGKAVVKESTTDNRPRLRLVKGGAA